MKISNRLIRTIILTVFVAITLSLSIKHFAVGSFLRPYGGTLCHYCPEVTLATSVLLLNGTSIAKVNVGNIVALLVLTVTTLALGRGFCAWICPFGAIFEYLNIIGNKLNIVREPPVKTDRFLKNLNRLSQNSPN
ncbi:MAG: 4Fe-4S binding protein [Methanosarcinaceae archaeon]